MKHASLKHQVKLALDQKLRIGESKHQAKIRGDADKYIYSWSTYRTYLKHCCYFVDFCKNNHECRDLQDCRQYVEEYMRSRAHLSAYTQKLELSAISKLFDQKFEIELNKRVRSEIKRSRLQVERDYHFSESKNQNLITFCKCTGLRRSELQAFRSEDLIVKNGQLFVNVHRASKGGKTRISPVIGTQEELKLVLQLCKNSERPFIRVNSKADIHSYRAEYCKRVYKLHERPLEQLSKEDLYICRKDKKGQVYDRKAMLIASQALGHNRISVIADHYLYD